MKAKVKQQFCEVPGCKQKAVCGWQPKRQYNKRIWVCRKHAENPDDCLWELAGVRKPEKIYRPKPVEKLRPKKEGKPKWQEVLDKWFAKEKYPVGNFMNTKRWEYWISIGGKKPEGDSRSWTEKAMDEMIAIAPEPKTKLKLKAKIKRKKSY